MKTQLSVLPLIVLIFIAPHCRIGRAGKGDTSQRAAFYAKMADTEMRQQLYADALQHIDQAILMDNANRQFYMQRGDINVAAGHLSAAVKNYDEAIAKGKNDAEAWKVRTTTLLRLFQQQYGVDNAVLLEKKISERERQALCNSIRASQEVGVHDEVIQQAQVVLCK